MSTEEKTLYLFIDESGNFDFSPKGTKYFILSAFATFDPITKRGDLVRLRYRLLAAGVNQEYFHATEDAQKVRDEVYALLASLKGTYEVHAVAAQKNKTNPTLYKEIYQKKGRTIVRVTGIELYRKLCECLLQYVFKGKASQVDKVVIVLGSIFHGEKTKVLLQTLKHFLKNNFPGVRFEIFAHTSSADLNSQLADYCCWAIGVHAERKEKRPYEVIKADVKSVFDMFKNGTTEYYQYQDNSAEK